jgi:hypothetical protein
VRKGEKGEERLKILEADRTDLENEGKEMAGKMKRLERKSRRKMVILRKAMENLRKVL